MRWNGLPIGEADKRMTTFPIRLSASPPGNPLQVVLFDWEGTLVDFQWNLAGAVRDAKQVLASLGLDPAGWENHYAALRNNAVVIATQRGMDKHAIVDRIDAVYDQYDLDAASRWSLKPDVASLLPYLRKAQVQIGLVSNIGRKAIEPAMSKLGVAELFNVIVTRNDVELVKPSGEGIRIALGKLGAKSADALFVGDSVSDILAARDGGIAVAIVQGGESAPTSLNAAGPDYLWKTLRKLET